MLSLFLKGCSFYSERVFSLFLKSALFILKGVFLVLKDYSFYSERLLFLLCHVDKVRYVLRSFTYVLQPRTSGADGKHQLFGRANTL